MRFHFAEPGTNPMETHAAQAGKGAGKIKLILAILGLLLMCGAPILLLSKTVLAKKDNKQPALTATITSSPTASPTVTSLAPHAATASQTPTSLATSWGTATPWPSATQRPVTQTPWVVTAVVTRVVNVPGTNTTIEKHFEVTRIATRIVTQIITATPAATSTPAPTQTPWIVEVTREVEATREIEVTRVVEVTREVTPTPTETPTETPTMTLEPPSPTPE